MKDLAGRLARSRAERIGLAHPGSSARRRGGGPGRVRQGLQELRDARAGGAGEGPGQVRYARRAGPGGSPRRSCSRTLYMAVMMSPGWSA
jgi:hypothetical protein